MFRIDITTDNAAFRDEETDLPNPGAELTRILRLLADRIEQGGGQSGQLFDINGNLVGSYGTVDEEEAR